MSTPFPEPPAFATYQGWLIVATGENVLSQTLDRVGGTATSGALSDEPHFKTLVGRLPADRLALQYLDSGKLFRDVLSGLVVNQAGVPPETSSLLSNIDSQLAVSFAAAAGGLDIRFEGATRLPPELGSQSSSSTVQWGDAGDAFARLPEDTLAAYGFGLPPLVPQVDQAVNLALQRLADRFQMPDLAELDLHPSQWLVGPIAVGGSAGNIGDPGGQPDLFMVARTSDTDAARADLASLTGLFPPKTVTPVSIAGARFIEAPAGGNSTVTYGVVDDWLYLVSGDTQAVVDAASAGGLTQNPRFQALQAGLGQDPTNVFIDIQGGRELASGMLSARDRQMYETQFALLINPLTLLGGGVRSDPNGDVHGRFLLGINGA